MSANLAITPEPQASQALLRDRLAQLEAALIEARGRIIRSFDRELASLRGWMASLEHSDAPAAFQSLDEAALGSPDGSLEQLLSEPPHPAASNIVPFSVPSYPESTDPAVEEQPLDPALASATMEELNAALASAFQQMSQQRSTDDRRRSA
jgi:hypothetical protein